MTKNTRELKQHNKYIVLNEIIDKQPVSRKELSQALDVSHATVSYIKDMINKMNERLNCLCFIAGSTFSIAKIVRRTEGKLIQLEATAKYVFDETRSVDLRYRYK